MANKSELSRMAIAQQRMQQNASGASAGSLGLVDGHARVQSHGGSTLTSENQVHQGPQSSGVGPHEGGNHQQESERSAVNESSIHMANDQPMHQGSSNINDGSQTAFRRSNALGLAASAASAFDAAKDIMEALRSKHTNLASELEVIFFSTCLCLWLHARMQMLNLMALELEVGLGLVF